jgi:hypothetical protein
MTVNIRPTPSPRRRDPLPHRASCSRPATAASADLEFGGFRVLLRRRQLLADGVAVELGGRALDVLLVLLEADGALVTKEELLSRVWPGVVVSEENLKSQVHALRKAPAVPRSDSYGIWPRLSVHRRAAHEYRIGALPANAAKAAVRPNFLPAELSAFAPMQCEFDLAH